MRRTLLISLCLAGCGAMDAAEELGANAPADPAGAADAGSAGDSLPPEREVEQIAFSPPAAGRHHVWVASPANDTVVRIDARTLAVSAVEVGDEPTVVRARAGHDEAVVLNRGSDELTRIVVDDDGGETLSFFDLPHHFNALTLHPGGRLAFCWLDLATVRPGEDTSGVQDLAVVDLEAGLIHSAAIGFRPRRLLFRDEGERLLVVTDDGLSVLTLDDLRAPTIARTVPLATDPLREVGREVAVSPDGRYAISRGSEERAVTLVDVDEGTPRAVDLGARPTDLDLLPDGHAALVMLRDADQAALVPVPEAALDPDTVRFVDLPEHRLGSAAVSPRGDVAVLYSTLDPEAVQPQVALLDLDTEAVTYLPLRKAVAGVVIDPSGRWAYVLHTRAEGEPDPSLDEAERLAYAHGYTLLDLDARYAKLQTTPAAPRGPLFLADGGGGYVLLGDDDDGVAEVQFIGRQGFVVGTFELGSTPEAVGVLPEAGRAFVTQTHPTGRISFLDIGRARNARVETLSGYLLNGRLLNGHLPNERTN